MNEYKYFKNRNDLNTKIKYNIAEISRSLIQKYN